MRARHVEVLVEEQSLEEALHHLLPRLLPSTPFAIRRHRGKSDLLRRLPERLRGYASWLPPDWRIVVVVDRDADDCQALKGRLEAMAADAGLRTRSASAGRPWQVVNRLAIEELESWYFGDWPAVRAAYPRVPAAVPWRAPFRNPDAIAGGTWEALERLLQAAGYFAGGLRKIEAARAIAPQMDHSRNRSRSFQAFRDALLEMSPA